MTKKRPSFTNISPEEVKNRLAQIEQAQALEKIQKSMKQNPMPGDSSASKEQIPLEDLRAVGKDEEEIYQAVCEELKQLLDDINLFAFSPIRKTHYFRNDKIISLLHILKKAKLIMECRLVMDVFKASVRERNGGKMPMVTERQGFFGKMATRAMRSDEIAETYTVEDDIATGNVSAIGRSGSKMGLMQLLSSRLLGNDEVIDPVKHGSRKHIGLFLEAAGLINTTKANLDEKYFIACLYTPEKIRPNARTDKDRLVKFHMILKRGRKWLQGQIKSMQSIPEGDTPAESAPPAHSTAHSTTHKKSAATS